MKGAAIRLAGSLVGVILGEISSLPFLPIFERGVGRRPEAEIGPLFGPYVLAITIVFWITLELYRRNQPLNARTGLHFGTAYGLAFALTLVLFLYVFTANEGMFLLGVFETFVVNFVLAGFIAGWLHKRFVSRDHEPAV